MEHSVLAELFSEIEKVEESRRTLTARRLHSEIAKLGIGRANPSEVAGSAKIATDIYAHREVSDGSLPSIYVKITTGAGGGPRFVCDRNDCPNQ